MSIIVKTATTFSEQICLLRERGMIVKDTAKAIEVLSDIGYYRLGFYWFPFEKGYPSRHERDHQFRAGTTFENAVTLYYFDHDLRNILTPFLHRIEIHLRTTLIYIVSNHYRNNPTWFADNRIVEVGFLDKLPSLYSDIRKNEAIRFHHSKHKNDIYAPAWKTLEYMTLGNILFLIDHLKNPNLRAQIASTMGIANPKVFASQMQTLRVLRNICAHGHNLFDLHLARSIKPGPIKGLAPEHRSTLSGALEVVSFLLGNISTNRREDFINRVNSLINHAMKQPIAPYISHIVPLRMP